MLKWRRSMNTQREQSTPADTNTINSAQEHPSMSCKEILNCRELRESWNFNLKCMIVMQNG